MQKKLSGTALGRMCWLICAAFSLQCANASVPPGGTERKNLTKNWSSSSSLLNRGDQVSPFYPSKMRDKYWCAAVTLSGKELHGWACWSWSYRDKLWIQQALRLLGLYKSLAFLEFAKGSNYHRERCVPHLTEPSSPLMSLLRLQDLFLQMRLISVQLSSTQEGNCSCHWDLLVVHSWWKPVHIYGDTRGSSILPLALLPAMPEQVDLAQKCQIGVRDIKGYSQAVKFGLEFVANGVVSNEGHQSWRQCWKQKSQWQISSRTDTACLSSLP